MAEGFKIPSELISSADPFLLNRAIQENFNKLVSGTKADRERIANTLFTMGLIPAVFTESPNMGKIIHSLQDPISADSEGAVFKRLLEVLCEDRSTEYLAEALCKTLRSLLRQPLQEVVKRSPWSCGGSGGSGGGGGGGSSFVAGGWQQELPVFVSKSNETVAATATTADTTGVGHEKTSPTRSAAAGGGRLGATWQRSDYYPPKSAATTSNTTLPDAIKLGHAPYSSSHLVSTPPPIPRTSGTTTVTKSTSLPGRQTTPPPPTEAELDFDRYHGGGGGCHGHTRPHLESAHSMSSESVGSSFGESEEEEEEEEEERCEVVLGRESSVEELKPLTSQEEKTTNQNHRSDIVMYCGKGRRSKPVRKAKTKKMAANEQHTPSESTTEATGATAATVEGSGDEGGGGGGGGGKCCRHLQEKEALLVEMEAMKSERLEERGYLIRVCMKRDSRKAQLRALRRNTRKQERKILELEERAAETASLKADNEAQRQRVSTLTQHLVRMEAYCNDARGELVRTQEELISARGLLLKEAEREEAWKKRLAALERKLKISVSDAWMERKEADRTRKKVRVLERLIQRFDGAIGGGGGVDDFDGGGGGGGGGGGEGVGDFDGGFDEVDAFVPPMFLTSEIEILRKRMNSI